MILAVSLLAVSRTVVATQSSNPGIPPAAATTTTLQCSTALAGCWPVRGKPTKCRLCEGKQQHHLRAAGCTEQDIQLYCRTPNSNSCAGYAVSGAGTSAVNGCYKQQHPGSVVFDLDSGHQLYSWQGTWHLGLKGKNVSYIAAHPTPWPPESGGGCGQVWLQGAGGGDPCPAVKRMIPGPIPPAPPGPPPPPPPAPAPPPPPMRLVWEDHFDGPSLNTSRWNVLQQVHRGGVYTADNVAIKDGMLILRTVAQNLTIMQKGKSVDFYVSSGAVNTSGLMEQRRGRWQARVKLPMVSETQGYTLHSSIWLFANQMAESGQSGCPQEIDIVEQYARAPGVVSAAVGNLHPFNGTKSTGCRKVPYTQVPSTAVGDWTSDWTTFSVDWAADWIAMTVNGKLYAHWAQPQAAAAFTDKLFLALTACVMERVPVGSTDRFPQEYLIDWVKIYEFTGDSE